jgi:hypothetical protein
MMSWLTSILSAILKVLMEFFWSNPVETTTKTPDLVPRLDDATIQLDELRRKEGSHTDP